MSSHQISLSRVLECTGDGGMEQVFRACDAQLERTATKKLLSASVDGARARIFDVTPAEHASICSCGSTTDDVVLIESFSKKFTTISEVTQVP